MPSWSVSFSVIRDAAWAPGIETKAAWLIWAKSASVIKGDTGPAVKPMPPMLRRRAGFLGRMALEVAYQCLGTKVDTPVVISSRHGEAARSVDLLLELANNRPLSPTSFGLSVHNATGGLFSIARADHANSIAIAGGDSTIEYAVIEACSLLATGAAAVLLINCDCPLPPVYSRFEDCKEQPYAWAWLIGPPADSVISLSCVVDAKNESADDRPLPPGLEILRFYFCQDRLLERNCDRRRWLWSRNA